MLRCASDGEDRPARARVDSIIYQNGRAYADIAVLVDAGSFVVGFSGYGLRGTTGSLPGVDANADHVAILLIWWMPGLRRWSRWYQENARLTSSVWLASGKCRVTSSVGLASGKCRVDVGLASGKCQG